MKFGAKVASEMSTAAQFGAKSWPGLGVNL